VSFTSEGEKDAVLYAFFMAIDEGKSQGFVAEWKTAGSNPAPPHI
jgi:hypothetical protein